MDTLFSRYPFKVPYGSGRMICFLTLFLFSKCNADECKQTALKGRVVNPTSAFHLLKIGWNKNDHTHFSLFFSSTPIFVVQILFYASFQFVWYFVCLSLSIFRLFLCKSHIYVRAFDWHSFQMYSTVWVNVLGVYHFGNCSSLSMDIQRCQRTTLSAVEKSKRESVKRLLFLHSRTNNTILFLSHWIVDRRTHL